LSSRGGVGCLACAICLQLAWLAAAWKNVEDGAAPNLKGARWFSSNEIMRMTNNFNDDEVLGEGGYAKVRCIN
jgi:hypothetical protein